MIDRIADYERNIEDLRPAMGREALLRLGTIEHDVGNLEEAERLLRAALFENERAPDADDASMISTLTALGQVLVARGESDEARALLASALRLRDRDPDTTEADLVILLNELSRVCLKEGAYTSAEPLLLRLLAIKRRKGEQHPEVATVLVSLGAVRQAQGDTEDAEARYREALVIREQALASNHFSVAATLEQLGNTLASRGKLAESIHHHQRALAIREPMLGAGHAAVRAARERIAYLQLQAAREEIAPWTSELLAMRHELGTADPRDSGRVARLVGSVAGARPRLSTTTAAVILFVAVAVIAAGTRVYLKRATDTSPYVEATSAQSSHR